MLNSIFSLCKISNLHVDRSFEDVLWCEKIKSERNSTVNNFDVLWSQWNIY